GVLVTFSAPRVPTSPQPFPGQPRREQIQNSAVGQCPLRCHCCNPWRSGLQGSLHRINLLGKFAASALLQAENRGSSSETSNTFL
uniref:Uncharacterized protein n=1 Tax=Mustela putorius furo TaxID=9669 RepID=M3XS30_MUSPF